MSRALSLTVPTALLLLAATACGKTGKNAYRVGIENPPPSEGGSSDGSDTSTASSNCATSLVAAGNRFCAAYQDGSVWCWGLGANDGLKDLSGTTEPAPVPGLERIRQLALGVRHACAIDDTEQLWCWGDNSAHQISEGAESPLPPTRVNVPEPLRIGVGEAHTCVTDAGQGVRCWGDGSPLPAQRLSTIEPQPLYGTSWFPVSGAPEYLDGYGRLYALESLEARVIQPAYGYGNVWVGHGSPQTCALKRDGSLWCSPYTAAEGAPLEANLALRESVMEAGVGIGLVCALTRQGQVWCEGRNDVGQTGLARGKDYVTGDFVPDLPSARRLGVGNRAACVIDDGGSVWCWGAYAEGKVNGTPTVVTSCTGQQQPVVVASAEWDSYAATEGWRLAHASQARGQALCRCALGTLEGCARDEDFAPNGTCLETVMAGQERPLAACRAEELWDEAQCWAAANCDDPKILPCAPSSKCNVEVEEPQSWSYCRVRACDSDRTLLRDAMCDNVPDCEDGSDELNCHHGPGFECAIDDWAFPETFGLCDGKPDCDNGNDERCF